MGIGRRLQHFPRLLDGAYRVVQRALVRLGAPRWRPHARATRLLTRTEEIGKRWIFDCRMCGQCTLHSTGMTCPMTCPKNLRNGPCGGVRPDGGCEVEPGKRCIWVDAVDRAHASPQLWSELARRQPPLDRRLEGTSAWMNLLREGEAGPQGPPDVAGSRGD